MNYLDVSDDEADHYESDEPMQSKDFQIAAKWADGLLQSDFCILDTETTGIDGTAEICQIGVIDKDGSVLFESLVKPSQPIPPAASAIHGITDEMVRCAPSMEEILLPLLKAVGRRDVAIYNAEFDLKLIRQSLRPYGIQLAFPTSDRRQCRIFLNGGSIHCVMGWYSQWVGEWNEHHGNYRWQKLPNGDHTALGDCKAALAVIHRMAASYLPRDPIASDTAL